MSEQQYITRRRFQGNVEELEDSEGRPYYGFHLGCTHDLFFMLEPFKGRRVQVVIEDIGPVEVQRAEA